MLGTLNQIEMMISLSLLTGYNNSLMLLNFQMEAATHSTCDASMGCCNVFLLTIYTRPLVLHFLIHRIIYRKVRVQC